MMFAKTSRAQLLVVTGWSSTDLDNRVHNNQLSLAHALTLPAETGTYLGEDCFALKLSDALVDAGFTRALAARFVCESQPKESQPKWWRGLERIEWPELFPPPVPMQLAPTKPAIDEGATGLVTDCEIYFAIAKNGEGEFRTACGTLAETFVDLIVSDLAGLKRAPVQITQVSLRQVYEAMREAARQKGVDLGTPFTRPEGHPEHKDWYAAAEVHRALSLQRQKKRKPPGPPRKRTRPSRKAQAMRAAASAEARKA